MARMLRSLIFACIFAVHFLSSQQVMCAEEVARNAEQPGLSNVNFVDHLFHYLNVSQVGSSLVNDITDCAFACLRVVTCFSYNVAAYPDVDDRILCELLASDKYNSSGKFEANRLFHHFTINSRCYEEPCVNGGKCSPLYSHDDFKCECPQEFMGKSCANDVDECITNKHNCSTNATCQNTEGSFSCVCNNGFQGDGVNCSDVDECTENKHNCSTDGTCQNTEGSFNCTCNDGFYGNGVQCTESPISLPDSDILKTNRDCDAKLNEYLTPVQVSGKQWKLCFRASEHQYSSAAFHAACDNKGPTVTLVRVGVYVFGGYTDKSWTGSAYMNSAAAFLFSLRNHLKQQHKMLTYRYQENAIYSSNSYGPTFGGGHDLHLGHSNTNSHSNLGYTYRAPHGYAFESFQAQTLLAGSHLFRCDEYEVFYQS